MQIARLYAGEHSGIAETELRLGVAESRSALSGFLRYSTIPPDGFASMGAMLNQRCLTVGEYINFTIDKEDASKPGSAANCRITVQKKLGE